MIRLQTRRGSALLTVISVMIFMALFLLISQLTVQMTHQETKNVSRNQSMEEAAASLAVLALKSPAGAPGQVVTAPNGMRAALTREPLPPGHQLWAKLPALKPQPGDELLILGWQGPGVPTGAVDRLIVNGQGLRRGVLDVTPARKPAPTPPAASTPAENNAKPQGSVQGK